MDFAEAISATAAARPFVIATTVAAGLFPFLSICILLVLALEATFVSSDQELSLDFVFHSET